MRRLAVPLVTAFGLALLVGTPAIAEHCGEGASEEVCVEGQGSGFDVDLAKGDGGKDSSPGGKADKSASSGPVVRKETRYAPTCTGNTVNDMGVLCNAAVETCPTEGDVRFWMWQRVQDDVTKQWSEWQLVDTVCLGPDDPAIDPAVAIPAIVQRDFKSVVVVRGSADVTPEPETLVNVVTQFRTDAPATYDIPLSILGQSVVITATAEKYTWHFGDGATVESYEPGGYAEHTYTRAVTRQAYVVITWSGSFQVNGGAGQAINGTATTQGAPTDVIVREARSELVRD